MKIVRSALPALLVAAGGVFGAWLAISGRVLLPAVLLVTFAIVGFGARLGARSALPADPEVAVKYLEMSVLLDGAVAAAVSWLLIWLGVQFEPTKTASEDEKQLLSAAFGALSAFLTTAFVKGAESADESWIAARVESAFKKTYADRFESGTEAWRAVKDPEFAGDSGWGYRMRRIRATSIKAGLG